MLERLKSWIGKLFRPYAPHIQPIAIREQHNWPNLENVAGQSRTYMRSSWVYVAVNRIAEAAALTPLQVYKMDGERQLEVVRHPLEVLLDNPNPFLSRFELFEQTVGMLELTGNAYWFLVGDARGKPTQIWPLRPDRVCIVPDGRNYVKGYVYEMDGVRIPLEPEEVVHFKRWHPSNDYYGLSALEAARTTIDIDLKMSEWNKNTFGIDNGVPAGIVNIKDYVPVEEYERIKREWRQTFGGPQRKTAFLRGGEIQWQNVGLNHMDMDFLKGRLANRDEILNIFGVPVGMVSDNATEANAKVAERTFIERTLWPKLVRISQKITQEMLPFWSGDHIAMFEDIRPTDVDARLNEIKVASSILSINEIRERYYHLPPVAWGERPVDMIETPSVGSVREPTENAPNNDNISETQIKAELAQWERFTLKRLGKDNINPRPFEVKSIPDDVAFEVSVGLLAADTPEAVKDVFADVMLQ